MVDTMDGGTLFQGQLAAFRSMRNNGVAVNSIILMKNILITSFRTHLVFCDYTTDTVILTKSLKKPVLLKPGADVVAVQSGLKLHFFSIDKGVVDLGLIQLSGSMDQAVLSVDGLYCLILEAPRLLRLLRVADLKEIGIYPCDCDVTCIEISRDGRHVLAGLSDTRLLSFLVVDPMCTSHMLRVEGLLQKPISEDEVQKRKRALAVIAADDYSNDKDDYDANLFEDINAIFIEPDDSMEYKRKVANYVADVKYRFWRSCSAASDSTGRANLDSLLVT